MVKKSKTQPDPTPALGVNLFEELSKLNNDLSNMHRELAKKNAELAKLNEEKNRFLGMAAHDIRKPLSIISMYSEFLQTELSETLTPKQQEFLDIIRRVGGSALAIVNDYLDFSKIEAGKLELKVAPTNIVALVRDVIRINQVLADKKSIAITSNIDYEDILVPIDEQKIRQVLDNLICNAVKFSPADTEITVSMTCRENAVTIGVNDNGPGIPEAEQKRLFAAYEQTSVKSIGSYSGAGLGLAIAKKIVTAHQGAIWVESRPGGGATFSFTLPLQHSA